MKCSDCKVEMINKGKAKIYKDANKIILNSLDCYIYYCNKCGQIKFYSYNTNKRRVK